MRNPRPTTIKPSQTPLAPVAITVSAVHSLAPYAVSLANSRGRVFAERPPGWRSEFQRDRDRIVHCAAFRRLEYKTQVFVNHAGDMFRTRLTHSLEVAQIARTIARALDVNEDLTEAIALAHDLGHTPFGHAGQGALHGCMREYGGFEHNLHALRIVESLEERYPEFPGLNLLYETREGMLKHCSLKNARALGALGQRFMARRQPSLEAQIANVADEIAYNHHDIDDGLRAGLLRCEQLRELPLFATFERRIHRRWPNLDPKRLRYSVIRAMLNYFVSDLIATTERRIAEISLNSVQQVRAQIRPVVAFSASVNIEHLALKQLLRRSLYQHPQVLTMARKSRQIVHALFAAYVQAPREIPAAVRPRGAPARARAAADYIAGMTDRFAIAEYARLSAHGACAK